MFVCSAMYACSLSKMYLAMSIYAQQYLSRFGYIADTQPATATNDNAAAGLAKTAANIFSGETLRKALIEFQHIASIPETGGCAIVALLGGVVNIFLFFRQVSSMRRLRNTWINHAVVFLILSSRRTTRRKRMRS